MSDNLAYAQALARARAAIATMNNPLPAESSSPQASVSTPPPVEFPWTWTLVDVLKGVYQFSDELVDETKAPRCLMLYADRLQVNWQESGVEGPAAGSVIEISFTCRPVAPASITILPRPAYA
jgi:hypothetical protein